LISKLDAPVWSCREIDRWRWRAHLGMMFQKPVR
jgi:hypothetical protein